MERSTIFHGKTHCKWWFSIAMLIYQRVTHLETYPDEVYLSFMTDPNHKRPHKCVWCEDKKGYQTGFLTSDVEVNWGSQAKSNSIVLKWGIWRFPTRWDSHLQKLQILYETPALWRVGFVLQPNSDVCSHMHTLCWYSHIFSLARFPCLLSDFPAVDSIIPP